MNRRNFVRAASGLLVPALLAGPVARAGFMSIGGNGRVPAQSGGGGDPDDNALANAMRAATVGDFGTFAIGNAVDQDPSDTGNNCFSYSNHLLFDPVGLSLYNWGGCHGTGVGVQRMFLSRYDIATSLWEDPVDPIPGGTDSPPSETGTHGFCCAGVDHQDGSVWGVVAYFEPDIPHRRSAAGVWSVGTTKPDRTNVTSPMGYHPGLYGGRGGLVYGSDGGIWTCDHRVDLGGTGAWTIILDRINQVDAMPDTGCVHCYNWTDQCFYIGGDSKVYRIPASAGAGTPDEVAPSGMQIGIWDADGNSGVLVSSGRGGLLMVMFRDGAVHQYNHATDAWSGQVATIGSQITGAPNHEWLPGAVPLIGDDYGGVVFLRTGSGVLTSTTGHFWKV